MREPHPDVKSELRRTLRARRHALSDHERKAASEEIAGRVMRSRPFLASRRIAAYMPADGEVDAKLILERARKLGKEVYLPVLSRIDHDRLWFARVRDDNVFRRNRYGIPEPRVPARYLLRANDLDLVLLPLVGFDETGRRLGMGGGYYDRSLAFLLARSAWRRPHLLGLAYECQKVERLPSDPWDVALDAVVTERAWYDAAAPEQT